MAIPQRIRDDAARAEEELRRLATDGDNPETPAEPPRSADDHFAPGTHPNQVPDAPATEPEATPVDAAEYARLKQQLETLQGQSNRDRARHNEAQTRIDVLERMIAARGSEPAPTPATPPARTQLVTAAEETEFGADLVDVMRRAAKEQVTDALRPVFDQLQSLATKIDRLATTATSAAQTSSQLSEQRFEERMNELVTDAEGRPDWKAIDNSADRGDTRFLDWLQQTGEYSSEPRLAVLQRAYQIKDAQKCSEFFLGFKQSVGMPNGKPQPQTPVTPAKDPAASMVAPSPVAPSNPSTTRGSGKKTYKIAEVEEHYDDKTKGKWKGREAEWKRIADDMDAAATDNRIVK